MLSPRKLIFWRLVLVLLRLMFCPLAVQNASASCLLKFVPEGVTVLATASFFCVFLKFSDLK